MCSLFTGGSHSSHYSARENVSVSSATTNLCVTGFTQPEKLKVLLDLMASQNDGLLDRFLIWTCKSRPAYMHEKKSAFEAITRQGGGFDFKDATCKIYGYHEEPRIYRFDESGYRLLEAVYNELVSLQLHDDKQFTDLAPCIGMRFQTRYIDYLGRIACTLHAMYQVLQHQIDGSQLVAIPEVIPYATLEMAKELLDFLTLQKEVLLESIIPERKTDATDIMQLDPIAIGEEERGCKKVLLLPGFAASIRDIQRAMKKTTTSSALERYLRRIESEELGKLIGAYKTQFFKNSASTNEQLAKFQISATEFKQTLQGQKMSEEIQSLNHYEASLNYVTLIEQTPL